MRRKAEWNRSCENLSLDEMENASASNLSLNKYFIVAKRALLLSLLGSNISPLIEDYAALIQKLKVSIDNLISEIEFRDTGS